MIAAIPVEVTVALIGGTASVVLFALTTFVASLTARDTRRRDMYARAFQVVTAYKEFPYVIRRRAGGDSVIAAAERARISEMLRTIQADISYFSAWMGTESRRVATTYQVLVDETRRVAGGQMHAAWSEETISDDGQMNMPNLGLNELVQWEQEFIAAAADHLSVAPWRRWRRSKP